LHKATFFNGREVQYFQSEGTLYSPPTRSACGTMLLLCLLWECMALLKFEIRIKKEAPSRASVCSVLSLPLPPLLAFLRPPTPFHPLPEGLLRRTVPLRSAPPLSSSQRSLLARSSPSALPLSRPINAYSLRLFPPRSSAATCPISLWATVPLLCSHFAARQS
jgi:hypothetical protein